LRIEAKLPADLWPECTQASAYLGNRILAKQLDWKILFEVATRKKPRYAHLHPYSCKAYPINKHLPHKKKLEPRAYIGYLVRYDSTNIF
jgi:hypothetical protein